MTVVGIRFPGDGASIGNVPDKPKTPISSFRIPVPVKEAAQKRADAEGKSLTEVVVAALKRYGDGKSR